MNSSIQQTSAEIDWLAVWRHMYTSEREQAESVTDVHLERHTDCWVARAQRFAALSKQDPQPDVFLRRLRAALRPQDTVLDIGAGTGRYVPLLARSVAQVVALEPSPAMRAHLEQRINEEQLQNVRVLAEQWPPDELPRADVVIAAHVLYAIREIGPFLQAMDAAAERACFLFLVVRHHNAVLSPFWIRFHGQPRLPLPGAFEALNVLYQLGIPANLEIVNPERRFVFADMDEALHEVRQRLRYAPDPQRDAQIMTAIDELLVRTDDGRLAFPVQHWQSAIIWWQSATARNVLA